MFGKIKNKYRNINKKLIVNLLFVFFEIQK
jgi:hypothetical protein